MSDQPVFVDGPLKGRKLHIDGRTRASGLAVPVQAEPASGPAWQKVIYRFTDVAMFGHTVLVGSVAFPPSSEDCFEALVSDEAKESARA
jgi:hypothetical protein